MNDRRTQKMKCSCFQRMAGLMTRQCFFALSTSASTSTSTSSICTCHTFPSVPVWAGTVGADRQHARKIICSSCILPSSGSIHIEEGKLPYFTLLLSFLYLMYLHLQLVHSVKGCALVLEPILPLREYTNLHSTGYSICRIHMSCISRLTLTRFGAYR